MICNGRTHNADEVSFQTKEKTKGIYRHTEISSQLHKINKISIQNLMLGSLGLGGFSVKNFLSRRRRPNIHYVYHSIINYLKSTENDNNNDA